MKIVKTLIVNRNVDQTWDFFQDVPKVATCFPGANLTEQTDDGTYKGNVSIKLGPFKATFEGEATYEPDQQQKSGKVEGKAIDKRGGSRSRLLLNYNLLEMDGEKSQVDFDADIQLAGPIAQFGRIGVIEEAAELLIAEFVSNVEEMMSVNNSQTDQHSEETNDQSASVENLNKNESSNKSISLISVVWSLIKSYFSKSN
tara:strand:- start:7 stop:606 length:600 start_codon:yes stop_codon:yes gene_type:complete